MTEVAKTKLHEFENLAYNEKLLYWDNNGISFRYDASSIGDDTQINIIPYSPADRIYYNKWIINHWRQYYFSGRTRKPGFSFRYKPFEDYKASFNKKIKFKKKGEVINEEILKTSNIITSLKVKRHILTTVYSNMKNLEEEVIYEYVIDPSSVLLNLRFIAQIFDLVKYIVFLKNERTLLKTGEKANPTYFGNMTDEKIEVIYQFLTERSFIAPSTQKDYFAKLLKNDEVPEDFNIVWIDLARISKQVNKHTLFEFVWAFIADDTVMRSFMKRYFKTFSINIPGSALRNLTTENIKTSWSKWLTKKLRNKTSIRQDEILKLIKTVQNM